jgi:site-specific DNA recombinase
MVPRAPACWYNPQGYDVRDRRLYINQEEAQKVKHIFERYLELGTVRYLKKDLSEREIVSATKLPKGGDTPPGLDEGRANLE